MSETVCRHCGKDIIPCDSKQPVCTYKKWIHKETNSHLCNMDNLELLAEPAPSEQPRPFQSSSCHESGEAGVKAVNLAPATSVAASPAEGPRQEWCRCDRPNKCADDDCSVCVNCGNDIDDLNPAAQPSPDAKAEEVAAEIIARFGTHRTDFNTENVVAILRPYFPADAPTLCPCKHIWLPSPKGKGYSCGVCGIEKSTEVNNANNRLDDSGKVSSGTENCAKELDKAQAMVKHADMGYAEAIAEAETALSGTAQSSPDRLQSARGAIKLILGRHTGVPWEKMTESEVDAYITEFESISGAQSSGTGEETK